MSQPAYPMPSIDNAKAFRAMRLANLHALIAEIAPGNERAAAAVARLEAITCEHFWQGTHHEDDKTMLRNGDYKGSLNCDQRHSH